MAYTLGIPSDGQSLGNSKPQVRGNFTTIFNDFAVNHIPFNSLGEGKHFFVQMPEVSDQTTSSNEGAVYVQEKQSYSNLVWQQESGGSDPSMNQGAIIQMTNVLPINATEGSTFLPGGMLMQFGFVLLDGSGNASIVFPYKFTLAGIDNIPWSIQLTLNTASNIVQRCVYASNKSATGFDIVSTNGQNRNVFWTAIGPKT